MKKIFYSLLGFSCFFTIPPLIHSIFLLHTTRKRETLPTSADDNIWLHPKLCQNVFQFHSWFGNTDNTIITTQNADNAFLDSCKLTADFRLGIPVMNFETWKATYGYNNWVSYNDLINLGALHNQLPSWSILTQHDTQGVPEEQSQKVFGINNGTPTYYDWDSSIPSSRGGTQNWSFSPDGVPTDIKYVSFKDSPTISKNSFVNSNHDGTDFYYIKLQKQIMQGVGDTNQVRAFYNGNPIPLGVNGISLDLDPKIAQYARITEDGLIVMDETPPYPMIGYIYLNQTMNGETHNLAKTNFSMLPRNEIHMLSAGFLYSSILYEHNITYTVLDESYDMTPIQSAGAATTLVDVLELRILENTSNPTLPKVECRFNYADKQSITTPEVSICVKVKVKWTVDTPFTDTNMNCSTAESVYYVSTKIQM